PRLDRHGRAADVDDAAQPARCGDLRAAQDRRQTVERSDADTDDAAIDLLDGRAEPRDESETLEGRTVGGADAVAERPDATQRAAQLGPPPRGGGRCQVQ